MRKEMEEEKKSELKELEIDKQIEILELVLTKFSKEKGFPLSLFKGFPFGLCGYIRDCLFQFGYDIVFPKDISVLIPLFQRKYADEIMKTRDNSGYWYAISPYDYENRLKFLLWILDSLKKQQENSNKIDAKRCQ